MIKISPPATLKSLMSILNKYFIIKGPKSKKTSTMQNAV